MPLTLGGTGDGCEGIAIRVRRFGMLRSGRSVSLWLVVSVAWIVFANRLALRGGKTGDCCPGVSGQVVAPLRPIAASLPLPQVRTGPQAGCGEVGRGHGRPPCPAHRR